MITSNFSNALARS